MVSTLHVMQLQIQTNKQLQRHTHISIPNNPRTVDADVRVRLKIIGNLETAHDSDFDNLITDYLQTHRSV